MTNIFPHQETLTKGLFTKDLSKLLDGVSEAAILVENQQIVAANAKVAELTAYTRRELIGKSIEKLISFGEDTRTFSITHNYSYSHPLVKLLTRNRKKIPSIVYTTQINDSWQLIKIEPINTKDVPKQEPRDEIETLELVNDLLDTLQISNLEKAISLTLSLGYKLLDANVLAIYVGNEEKPSARRIGYFGNIKEFPSEIFSSDLTSFNEPTLWIKGQRSITTFLHQAARSAGYSYLATHPIGEVGAIIGLIIAGGYQDPPPLNSQIYLRILGGIFSTIINRSALISNLKKSSQENIQYISLLESAKNAISDGIAIVNPDLTIDEINKSAEVVLGYSNCEVRGMAIDEIFIGTYRLVPALKLAFQGITTTNLGDVKLNRRDGSEFPAEISAIPIRHGNTTIGAFIILRDKSENEEIRLRANQLEQQANLGEVTAIFAHEVRNPINNISMGLQLMVEDLQKDDPNREIIGRMLQDCNRLKELMESILSYSCSGNYNFEHLDIGNIINNMIKIWIPRMSRLNIKCYVKIPAHNIVVVGDKRALEQVLTNLITNAIQAMQDIDGGSLAIIVSQYQNEHGRLTAQIDISDTGPGIPEESQQKIFEPFYTTKEKGTGLGLAITKQIVTAHKGSINLTSFPGATVFHLKLPAINGQETT